LIYPVSALRLAVYQHNGVPRVLAGSTFWPRLLVLRLGDAVAAGRRWRCRTAWRQRNGARWPWRRAAARAQINTPAV
jgi:toxin CptA